MSKTRADETNNFYLIIARRLALTLMNTHQLMVGALIVAKEVEHMGRNRKQTSAKVASKASKILTDGRYGKDSKSVAASALAQAKPSKRGK